MDIYKEIRRLWMDGVTQRQIASRLHISRNTVKKYCDGDTAPWVRKTYHRESSVLTDDIVSFVQHCLDEDKLSGIRKQQHTAKRIYDRLVEERHFTGGESTIRRLVQQLKERTPEAFVPLAFPAGDAVQVDWGEATVYLAGEKMKVNLFCARLCFSDAPFVIAYRRQNQESFLDAFVHVFHYFGGVPRRVIFDNARVAVKDGFGAHAKKQKEYGALAAHYGFDAIFCNPASGNEKGLVEGLVGYIRRNVCVPIPKVQSLDELNDLLLDRCRSYLAHHVRGKEDVVGEMLKQDQASLYPLPGRDYDPGKRLQARVDRFCTVRFDTNNYSVPVAYCGREVTVKGLPEAVEILCNGEIIARHVRCLEHRKNIYELEHYLPLLERKGRAILYARPVRETLPPNFLTWLEKQSLSPKELVHLLSRCKEEGCDRVMSGVSQEVQPIQVLDEVKVQAVDLSIYDALCKNGGEAV